MGEEEGNGIDRVDRGSVGALVEGWEEKVLVKFVRSDVRERRGRVYSVGYAVIKSVKSDIREGRVYSIDYAWKEWLRWWCSRKFFLWY